MDIPEELDCLYDDHFGRHSDGLSAISNCSSVSNETEDALDWDDTEDVDGACLRHLEDRIQEIMVSEREDEEVEHIEDEGEDDDESFTVADFECRCSVSCISQFEQSEIQEHIMNICEMTKEEKDMYLMGVLQPIGVSHTKTWRGERKRKRYGYTYGGKNVCRSTFQYIFNIGRRALTSLITHMNVNGKVPRIHGNKGRKPHNSLKYNEIKHCVDFVLHYSNEHGLPQPAAPRGRDGEPPVYLPASLTKYSLHKEYVAACQEINIRALGLSSFKSTWLQCLPHIRISNPRDDVCQTCEIIRKKISDAVSEEEKLTASTELSTHIEKAQLERGVYKQSIKCAFDETPPQDEGVIPPVSKDLHKIHYTFDFSQQVTIPHHYRQMGPLYFMTPRRVQLFGVRLDGASLQYNYLIDEDQTIGKDGTKTHGPNSTISMLNHALTYYGYGEKGCVMHCDNCPGQNKNQYMLAYLCWRTMIGLHDQILLYMQVPGHTRCLVDSGFAHIKKLYRRSDVDCLDQMCDVVNKSSTSNVAVSFLNKDGEQNWEWADWKAFLSARFKPVPNIRKYHHFRFSKEEPGCVFVKTGVEDQLERMVNIRKEEPLSDYERPSVIHPAGLSEERLQYLYKTVRPVVRTEFQNKTCPLPGAEE